MLDRHCISKVLIGYDKNLFIYLFFFYLFFYLFIIYFISKDMADAFNRITKAGVFA